MKEANESKKRDEMVETAKHFIRRNIQKEFSDHVRDICMETGMTRNEVIDSAVNITILSHVTNLVLSHDLPDSFWMRVYHKAKEGNVLDAVVDCFSVRIVIGIKNDTSIFIPKSGGGMAGVYA